MRIIPSIDIKDGRCVKLVGGKKGSGMVVSEDPVSIARFWEEEGAKSLHVVDLDGAIEGERRNRFLIENILKEVSIPIEVGGGLRSVSDVIDVLSIGARWAIVGTTVLEDQNFLKNLVDLVGPSKIIVALDSKKGKVMKRGWIEETTETPAKLAKKIEPFNIAAFLYTDVAVEGSELGVNVDQVKSLVSAVRTPILYAGGVSSLTDIATLAKLRVNGTIVGSALYKNRFTLKEAMSVAGNSSS